MPSSSPTICMVAPAPRLADSQPPKTSVLERSIPGMALIASAREAATSVASVNPPAGPSTATSSNGTFWATVIMTCWSLAFGPSATRVTLLPGWLLARWAASYRAWLAQGSSTAGSIISFLRAGPAGPDTGSSVWSGSGTTLPQTTIWNAVLMFLVYLTAVARPAGGRA